MSIPPDTFFGVDSLLPITSGRFKLVEKNTGQKPQFWGRYIGIPNFNTTGHSELTEGEIDVLRTLEGNPRFFLIYNAADLQQHVGVNIRGKKGPRRDPEDARLQGVLDATAAIVRASLSGGVDPKTKKRLPNLKVPDGTPIFANLEQSDNGTISPDWIKGWCETFLGNKKFPNGGLYGFFGPDSDHPELALGSACIAAIKKMAFKPLCWSAAPHRGGFNKLSQISLKYEPQEPVDRDSTASGTAVMWQYQTAWAQTVIIDKATKEPVIDPKTQQPKKDGGAFDTNLAKQKMFDLMAITRPAGGVITVPGVLPTDEDEDIDENEQASSRGASVEGPGSAPIKPGKTRSRQPENQDITIRIQPADPDRGQGFHELSTG
jgi:hypothetical protein